MDQKRLKAELIIERSAGSSGAMNRVKGAIQKGNIKGELGGYFGKMMRGKWEERKPTDRNKKTHQHPPTNQPQDTHLTHSKELPTMKKKLQEWKKKLGNKTTTPVKDTGEQSTPLTRAQELCLAQFRAHHTMWAKREKRTTDLATAKHYRLTSAAVMIDLKISFSLAPQEVPL